MAAMPENPKPLASVITPTFGRPDMLPHAYKVFSSQTIGQAEWIVVDDSPDQSPFMLQLTDPRVRYLHLPERTPTGEKRNIAIDRATSDVIVQFDDDDYYSPTYIATMIECMESREVDFVKLCGFFLYSKIHGQFGYWDASEEGWSPFFTGPADRTVEVVELTGNDEMKGHPSPGCPASAMSSRRRCGSDRSSHTYSGTRTRHS